MKNMNCRLSMFIAFSFVIGAFLFTDMSQTAMTQSQQPPIKIGGNNKGTGRPEQTLESKVDSLMNRVAALEAENKELKQQMFAAKLLLSGLDKAFGTHTHSLTPYVSSNSLRQLDAVPGNVRDRWQILTIATGQTTAVMTGPPNK